MSYTHKITMPAIAVTIAFALSACSTDSSAPVEPNDSEQQESEQVNDADIEFTTGMIPHHQQAVEMSQMAVDQGGPELVALAEQIEDAQGPEIETMTSWLKDWEVKVPTGMGAMGDMDMMDPGDMQEMMNAEGGQFDTAWLEMMIEHHEGAISMSQIEQEEGVNTEAVDLAGTIIEAQQAEIVEMEQMLETDQ